MKILITTSGIGARLGNITKFTNKSLVNVGDRAALSYIIEHYPEEYEIVITLGYYGNHVRDYLELAYPNRNITFVNVDKYEGEGSSLVYSLLCAKEHLQSEFIFHACDTIVLDDIEEYPKCNWLGGYKGKNSSDYRTLKTLGNNIQYLCDKGESSFDYIYIGIAGIKDWELFWDKAEKLYKNNQNNKQLSDGEIIREMICGDCDFNVVEYKKWFDIGNVKCLQKAKEHFKPSYNVLDKETESLHVFDDFIIKFFSDTSIVSKRIERGKILYRIVPDIIGYRENFYKYKKVYGEVLSKIVTERIFNNLLDWAFDNLWIEKNISELYKDKCYDFYFTKTIDRVNKFCEITGKKHKTEFINDIEVPSVIELLDKIPCDFLCTDTFYTFHGDFIAENLIYNNGSFTAIDYRQDFAGDIKYGDIYYDLAKLNHNLILNHDILNKNLYDINITSSNITVDILRQDKLCKLQDILFETLENKGFDIKKINILSSIIWLNMSGLHEYPLNVFLYYFGRYNLYRYLKKYGFI